ncbi:hypothetical protein NQ315_017108 [Exocentrus adspersus]|uniref:Uncharacterized protein n=1 Tax=Exocentrus adspersus TaxID=1586481 RepID=A0AAV8VHL2_9CUCU|nr:hypothetical protein NQ315_017108 [Exocentrus adspersus]
MMEPKPATCLICLNSNYNEKTLLLFDLFTQEWDNVTYLTKLQNVLNAEIVVYEQTFICSCCLDELNRAYVFREKVLRALEYWNTKFEDVAFQNKLNEQTVNAVNTIDDNNEISEMNNYNVDIVTLENNINIKSIVTLDNNIPENIVPIPENLDSISENLVSNIETIAENMESISDETENISENFEEKTNVLPVKDNNKVENDTCIFPCDKCKTAFLTASELLNHTCAQDQIEKPPEKDLKKRKKHYRCDLCELSFSKVWKYNKHLKKHAVDKKFVCTYCNQAFKQSYHLREHITSHTGERNFGCGVCGKKIPKDIVPEKTHAYPRCRPGREIEKDSNLEPNLSQTQGIKNKGRKEYDVDDVPLYDHQGFMIVCGQ